MACESASGAADQHDSQDQAKPKPTGCCAEKHHHHDEAPVQVATATAPALPADLPSEPAAPQAPTPGHHKTGCCQPDVQVSSVAEVADDAQAVQLVDCHKPTTSDTKACGESNVASPPKSCCTGDQKAHAKSAPAAPAAPAAEDKSLCSCCVSFLINGVRASSLAASCASLNVASELLASNVDELSKVLRKCCQLLECGLRRRCCFLPAATASFAPAGKQAIETKAPITKAVATAPTTTADPTVQAADKERLALELTGMDCADCSAKVSRAISRLPSATPLDLDYLAGLASLTYDPEIITAEAIAKYVARATGFGVKAVSHGATDPLAVLTLPVSFASTPSADVCARYGVELDAKREATVSFPVRGAEARQPREVLRELQPFGAKVLPALSDTAAKARVTQDFRKVAAMALASCILSVPVLVLAWAPLAPRRLTYGAVSVVLTTLIQMLAFPILAASVRSIVYLHQADMSVLVSISTLTAYIFSVVAFACEISGHYFAEPFFETTAVLISVIYLGRTVQAATRRATGSIYDVLQKYQPSTVELVEQAGKEHSVETIDARLLHYGDVIRIRPDSRVPTDGVVVAGISQADESTATGEALPSAKTVGSAVIAGTLNMSGVLEVQVTRLVHENSLSRVSGLVQLAQASRSHFRDIADRFAALILPLASGLALLALVTWILVNRYKRDQSAVDSFVDALTYSLAILIVSCPCAVGLAIPLVVSSAMRAGVRHGVLFKSAEAILSAHDADVFAFDKTGTLSQGRFTVQESVVLIEGVDQIVLSLVSTNEHPISKAIARHIESLAIDAPSVSVQNATSMPGMGIKAEYGGYTLLAGQASFTGTSDHADVQRLIGHDLTLFAVTLGGQLVAAYGLADQPRSDAGSLVAALQGRNKRVVLLSGDNKGAVTRFANSVNISPEDSFAACSPSDKAKQIGALQKQGTNKVCFVGDGTNDGPALAQADMALSIGSGSEVAVSASGAILLGNDLQRSVLSAIGLAAQARQHAVASLAWCFVYFLFAFLYASGALVNIRLTPQWAGLGELISVLPVVAIGLGLDLRWRLQASERKR